MAVYSMTGYASATAGAGAHLRQHCTKRREAPSAAAPAASVDGRTALGQRPLSRPRASACPTSCAALEPALRELLGAALQARQDRAAADHAARCRQRLAAAAAEQLEPARAPRKHGAGLAAEGARAVGPRGRCSGARAARQPSSSTRPRSTPAERAIERPARGARARRRAAGRGADGAHRRACASWPPQAEPLVPAVVQRQQQRFLERWQEALDAAGAAQIDRRARRCRSARSTKPRPTRSASTSPKSWRGCARTSTRSRAC